jgi:hypothetical protein
VAEVESQCLSFNNLACKAPEEVGTMCNNELVVKQAANVAQVATQQCGEVNKADSSLQRDVQKICDVYTGMWKRCSLRQ